ncbi:MAG: hypothetical protein WC129_00450 [Sphaerochaetaceae bacterium]
MKKRLLVLFLILALIPAAVFADFFDFGIGATAQFIGNFDLTDTEDFDWSLLGDVKNYGFGADIRTRVMFVELDVTGLYNQRQYNSTDYHEISGLITGGLSLDLLGLVRIGLGMGPRVNVWINQDDGSVMVYNQNGVLDASTDFADAFMNAPMTYRATADVKLGNLLVGLNYIVDSSGFTFENPDTTKLAPNFDAGRIGASATFILF